MGLKSVWFSGTTPEKGVEAKKSVNYYYSSVVSAQNATSCFLFLLLYHMACTQALL